MPTITVKSGDTLSGLAQQYGYGGDYMSIAKANNIANPNVIKVGQTINIPDRPGQTPAPTPQAPSPTPQFQAPQAQPQQSTPSYSAPASPGGVPDEGALIAAMTQKGHTPETARAAIAGRGVADLAREYLGYNPGSSSSGVSGLGTFNQPTIDLPSLYNTLYDSSGIKAKQAELDEKERQFTEVKGKINDDPYLSESTRIGRVAKLEQLHAERTANLRNEIASSKADVETQLGLKTKQFDITNQQSRDAFNQLSSLVQMGALTSASGDDIAQLTRATGVSGSMITSIIEKQKKDAELKPTLIQSTNNKGEVTVTAIDPRTGKPVSSSSLGFIGAADKPTGPPTEKPVTQQQASKQVGSGLTSLAGRDGKVSEEDYLYARSQWAALGFSTEDFDKQFGLTYVNPQFYKSYQIVDKNTAAALAKAAK